jgi:hypothetical protein
MFSANAYFHHSNCWNLLTIKSFAFLETNAVWKGVIVEIAGDSDNLSVKPAGTGTGTVIATFGQTRS